MLMIMVVVRVSTGVSVEKKTFSCTAQPRISV